MASFWRLFSKHLTPDAHIDSSDRRLSLSCDMSKPALHDPPALLIASTSLRSEDSRKADSIIINGAENKDVMNNRQWKPNAKRRDTEDFKPTAKRSKAAPSTPEASVDCVGQRVAKLFPGYKAPFFGIITSQEEENGEDTLWAVQYDDGDKEDLNEQEVQEGIKLYFKKKGQELKLLDIYHLDPLQLQSKKLPKALKAASETVIKFYLFLLERQLCWERRQVSKDRPLDWTSNHVFRNYFFCNNYRELDRGTSYFHSQMLEKFESSSVNCNTTTQLEWIETVLWSSYCYRLSNRSDSFSNVGDYECATKTFNGIPSIDKWPSFSKLVTKAQQEGHKFFTGAHQTCSFASYTLWMKEACAKEGKVVKQTAQQIYECAQKRDLKGCFQAISKNGLKGVGDFFSWQITCDLMESRCLPKCTASDFCALGPGAKAGIQELFFSGKKESLSSGQYLGLCKHLVDYQDEVYEDISRGGLTVSFPKWRNRSLTLKEIEHALCEFSKFQRIERAVGKKQNTGQRLRKSRSSLDDIKSCPLCCSESDRASTSSRMCDTCGNVYCPECDDSQSSCTTVWWVCRRCVKFENMKWD